MRKISDFPPKFQNISNLEVKNCDFHLLQSDIALFIRKIQASTFLIELIEQINQRFPGSNAKLHYKRFGLTIVLEGSV